MSITIPFGSTEVIMTGEGMVWLPRERLLCAADIHFEKSTFFSRFGTFLPPYDSAETLQRLEISLNTYQPEIFIALGDSFHDVQAGTRMAPEQITHLNRLINNVPTWHWIIGNHDPEIAPEISGNRIATFETADIIFRHEFSAHTAKPEISGHFHPKFTTHIKGHRISAPCFLYSKSADQSERLMLPAFGTFTGGLEINNSEIMSRIPLPARRIFLIRQEKIFEVNSKNKN